MMVGVYNRMILFDLEKKMSDKVIIAKKIISTSETLYFNSQVSNHLLDQKLVIVTSSTSHEPLALTKAYNSYIINYFILASSKIFFLSTTPSGIHPDIYICNSPSD